MAIKKLFSKDKVYPKLTVKSVRLRKLADEALQILSEKSGKSQNETLNLVLEESYEEYKIFDDIELYWKKYPENTIQLFKVDRFEESGKELKFSFTLRKFKSDLRCKFKIYLKTGTDQRIIFSNTFRLMDLMDLVDFGVSSSFTLNTKVYWEQE